MAPDDNAALVAGFVAAEAKRRIVGVELGGEDVAAADGLDEIADVEKHHVSVPETPGGFLAVVAVLFADVEDVMRGGELVHHTDGIFVAGVRKLSSVQNADDGHVVPFDAAVDRQPVVWARFLFVVVNMGIARIPVVFLWEIPSVQYNLDVPGAVFGHVHHRPQGLVFRSALHQNVGAPAAGANLEGSVAEEERRAGAPLEHGLTWMCKTSVRRHDVNLGVDLFTGRAVDNMPSQNAHKKLRVEM